MYSDRKLYCLCTKNVPLAFSFSYDGMFCFRSQLRKCVVCYIIVLNHASTVFSGTFYLQPSVAGSDFEAGNIKSYDITLRNRSLGESEIRCECISLRAPEHLKRNDARAENLEMITSDDVREAKAKST